VIVLPLGGFGNPVISSPAVPAVPDDIAFEDAEFGGGKIPEFNSLAFDNPEPCGVRIGNTPFDCAELESATAPEGIEFEMVEFWKAGFGVAALESPQLVGTSPERAALRAIEPDGPATPLVLLGSPASTEEGGGVDEEPRVYEVNTGMDEEPAAEEFVHVEFDGALKRAVVGAKLKEAVSGPVALGCLLTSLILFGKPAGMEEGGRIDDELRVFEGMSVDEVAAVEDEGILEDKTSVPENVSDEMAELEDCTDDVADKLELDVDEDKLDDDPEVRSTTKLH